MEGTLTPEIWEQVAIDSGISELSKTTRYTIILRSHGLQN